MNTRLNSMRLLPVDFVRGVARWSLAALALSVAAALNAASVSETVAEFHASGDCNGDGRLDAIVLDKATGNVRVGYQNANGTLTWANAVPSGVAHATSVAVGRFLHASRDSVAVTSEEFNRVHVLRLETPGAAPAPVVTHPPHGGLSMLVALDNIYGTGNFPGLGPDWLATGAHDPGITLLDLIAYSLTDLSSSFQDQIVSEGVLESGSALRRRNGDVSLFAAMRRGSNDTFVAYAYTNTIGAELSRDGLPQGTEFVAGRFYNQTYAQ